MELSPARAGDTTYGNGFVLRKLTYFIGASLDGFIAAEDGGVESFPIGDDVIAHIVAEYPETLPTHIAPHVGITPDTKFRHFDTVIMGRGTYEPAARIGITNPYAHLRTYVATRTITESPDPDVTLVADDPIATVRALKAEPGEPGIWLAGGGRLAGALAGEIDELVIKTYPILLGSGIPMLAGEFATIPFTRTDGLVLAGGAMVTRYVRT
jgi:dihydrofolate reductase